MAEVSQPSGAPGSDTRADPVGPASGGDWVEVAVAGELDVARGDLATELTAALDSGAGRIVVNLLDVSFIDSSVLRVLLLAHREVQARSGWIRLVYTNHIIGRVISVTGLEHVLPQYASVAGAVAGRSVGDDSGRTENSHGS